MLAARASAQAPPLPTVPNPKQPYGGLVPSQPKGTRAYTDAAAYNQHLNQHQSYTAQAASQAAQQPIRNPYVSPPQQQPQHQHQPPPPQHVPSQVYDGGEYAQSAGSNDTSSQNLSQAHRLQHQPSTGALASSYSQPPQHPPPSSYANPNPPTSSYYPASRVRANTINQMDHAIPPQIARIASLGMEVSGIKRNTLTPVLHRDDAIKEWERRASGQRAPPGPMYPQLEYLQQQAELASSNNWNGTGGGASRRYHPPSSLQHFQTPPSALTVDSASSKHHRELSASGGLRDVSMASISSRPSAGYDQPPHTNLPPAPPQAYSSSSASARYGGTSQPPQQQPSSYQPSSNDNSIPYDAYDHRDGLGTLYTPMQPNVLPSGGTQQQMHFSAASNGGNLASASSFYGGGIVPSSSQQQPVINVVSNQRQQPHQTGEWSR